jgi:hypothetical protein
MKDGDLPIFTSGQASETSSNEATAGQLILSLVKARKPQFQHIITSLIQHVPQEVVISATCLTK